MHQGVFEYDDVDMACAKQDSLGGTAKTALIICCSPCMSNASETLSSLRFGARAKGITNSIQSNACSIAGKDVANLLVTARRECDDLRNQVKHLEELQLKLMAPGSAEDTASMAAIAASQINNANGNARKECCHQAVEAAHTRLVLFCFALGMLQLLGSGIYIWWRRTTCVI